MATGGTIPTNRTQKVTFYNTTSVIERDKNIYYAPRFSKALTVTAGNTVTEAWLKMFKTVCPPSSDYTDIEISSWSPQDRTLKVRGNIDDFRIVTDEGKCLNYFILERTVTTGSGESAVSNTYHYAFFISGAQQVGGSSVLLTIIPDDFTNVFYLHNKHILTASEITNDYEPFNEKMKNCYVNRQHYDRVRAELGRKSITERLTFTQGSYIPSEVVYTVEEGEEISDLHFTVFGQIGTGDITASIQTFLDVQRVVVSCLNIPEGQTVTAEVTVNFASTTEPLVFKPDNMKVFLNQEESFRFKYQYRDMKYPICDMANGFNNFSDDEIETIKSTDSFNDLSQSMQFKIVRACLAFLVFETKSLETQGVFASVRAESIDHAYNAYKTGNLIPKSRSFLPNFRVAFPTFIIPDFLEKYRSNINALFRYKFEYNNNSVVYALDDSYEVMRNLATTALADYIYDAYLIKDLMIPYNKVDISKSGSIIIVDFKGINPFSRPDPDNPTYQREMSEVNIYPFALRRDISGEDLAQNSLLATVTSDYSSISSISIGSNILRGISVNGYEGRKISLKLSYSVPDLKNNYYDIVLESEPYKFYSISTCSGYELALNKSRYYSNVNLNDSYYTVNFNYYISINGAVKIGIIPEYTVENKTTLYFNEGLVFTTSSSIPLVSDSYATYYYRNKSQMKAQYAINDFNKGIDLLQHFFISGPNAVGYNTGKKALSAGGGEGTGAVAGYTALLETGNQVMQMIDEGVDWAQSNHVIELNQKARLADIGRAPDTIKQSASDLVYDSTTGENVLFINHYTIDELSYNSIAKMLERVGYQVNLYDTIHAMDRVGWNFVKLNNFDYYTNITIEQENTIKKIFFNGVTLLHDKSYLTSGHNYEKILEE